MKTLTALALIAGILYASNAVAAIKWVNGYNRKALRKLHIEIDKIAIATFAEIYQDMHSFELQQ